MEDVTVNTALLFMEDDPDRNVNNGYIKTKKISPANETQCLLKVRKKEIIMLFWQLYKKDSDGGKGNIFYQPR